MQSDKIQIGTRYLKETIGGEKEFKLPAAFNHRLIPPEAVEIADKLRRNLICL